MRTPNGRRFEVRFEPTTVVQLASPAVLNGIRKAVADIAIPRSATIQEIPRKTMSLGFTLTQVEDTADYDSDEIMTN
ncbi:hypothetical protein C8Q79DRAFT_1008779 [Trametes meyenii]|nr:hypothetical protein C8Q79DRAFT_1008779 [Trametes meyenii]